MSFNEHFLRRVLPKVSIITDAFPEDARFSIDSRTLQPGEIFVALKGEHVDGHNFIANALQAGAAGLIIASDQQELLKKLDTRALKNKLIVAVPDTLNALFTLATAWRIQYTYPVLAITGSVGKTSTKEMVATIMRAHKKQCLVAFANQNTKIGIALNILRMRADHDCAIFEVGISQRGEMGEIADMLRPTIGLITCIGHCHMEGLGSLVDIATEKRTLFKYFSHENIGIVNGDQALLANVSYSHPIVKFGLKSTNQVQARKVVQHEDHISCLIKMYQEKYAISFPHIHHGMLNNALAAFTAAYLMGASSEQIIATLQQPITVSGRFERRTLKYKHKGSIINDAYNANPESMKTALATFSNIQTRAKKIIVIGDMLELGTNSAFWHRQLGRILRKMSASHEIVLVGEHVQWIKKALPVGAHVDSLSSWQEAVPVVEKKIKENEDSLILIKGSHGTGLHNIADALAEKR